MNGVLAPGCRVRLKRALRILNIDLVPAGVTGVVVAASSEELVVRLDERRPGLDAWGNEARLYPGDAPDHTLEAFGWWLFEPIGPACTARVCRRPIVRENVPVATVPI